MAELSFVGIGFWVFIALTSSRVNRINVCTGFVDQGTAEDQQMKIQVEACA